MSTPPATPTTALRAALPAGPSARSAPASGCVPCLSRRTLLGGAGAAAVTLAASGCAVYGGEAAAPAAAPAQSPARGAGSGEVLVALDAVPVGGGVILADAGVVVTRVDQSTVRGFSTTCTHAGCSVSEVTDGLIRCPCHGSRFAIADGSVANGPAPSPLPEVPVAVSGTDVVRA